MRSRARFGRGRRGIEDRGDERPAPGAGGWTETREPARVRAGTCRSARRRATGSTQRRRSVSLVTSPAQTRSQSAARSTASSALPAAVRRSGQNDAPCAARQLPDGVVQRAGRRLREDHRRCEVLDPVAEEQAHPAVAAPSAPAPVHTRSPAAQQLVEHGRAVALDPRGSTSRSSTDTGTATPCSCSMATTSASVPWRARSMPFQAGRNRTNVARRPARPRGAAWRVSADATSREHARVAPLAARRRPAGIRRAPLGRPTRARAVGPRARSAVTPSRATTSSSTNGTCVRA